MFWYNNISKLGAVRPNGRMRVKFETVLFDFDGTIAESGEGIVRSARWAMEQLGKAAPGDDVLRRFVGPRCMRAFRSSAD